MEDFYYKLECAAKEGRLHDYFPQLKYYTFVAPVSFDIFKDLPFQCGTVISKRTRKKDKNHIYISTTFTFHEVGKFLNNDKGTVCGLKEIPCFHFSKFHFGKIN